MTCGSVLYLAGASLQVVGLALGAELSAMGLGMIGFGAALLVWGCW